MKLILIKLLCKFLRVRPEQLRTAKDVYLNSKQQTRKIENAINSALSEANKPYQTNSFSSSKYYSDKYNDEVLGI